MSTEAKQGLNLLMILSSLFVLVVIFSNSDSSDKRRMSVAEQAIRDGWAQLDKVPAWRVTIDEQVDPSNTGMILERENIGGWNREYRMHWIDDKIECIIIGKKSTSQTFIREDIIWAESNGLDQCHVAILLFKIQTMLTVDISYPQATYFALPIGEEKLDGHRNAKIYEVSTLGISSENTEQAIDGRFWLDSTSGLPLKTTITGRNSDLNIVYLYEYPENLHIEHPCPEGCGIEHK